jgi:hypothetical protein
MKKIRRGAKIEWEWRDSVFELSFLSGFSVFGGMVVVFSGGEGN